ncbi:DMT family transporter [Paenibacillus rigui]|nr:DMT family transporter [Paenibacillus rigui]
MRNMLVYAALIGSALFWGANFNLGKLAIDVMDPMSVIAWRFVLASFCMLLLFWFKERPSWSGIRPYLAKYALIGLIGVFGTNALVFAGLKHTSSINAALITATNPSVTVILSVWLLREKIAVRQMAGIVISFLGVLFVITGGSLAMLRAISVGDLMVFIGNASWAVYGVLGRKLLSQSTPLATSAITMLAGSLCLLPFIRLSHAEAGAGYVLQMWLAIGCMAIFGTFMAYLWWNWGISRIGTNRTAVFFNLVPISTMLITLLSGGTIVYSQSLGVIIVIIGVVLSTWKPDPVGSVHTVHRLQTEIGKGGK